MVKGKKEKRKEKKLRIAKNLTYQKFLRFQIPKKFK